MKYCRRLWFQAEIFSNSFFFLSPGSFSLHLFKFGRDEKACAWNCTTFRCIGRIYSVEPNVLDHFGGHCLRCYLSLNNVYNIGIPFYLYGNHVVRCTFSTIRRFVCVFFLLLLWFDSASPWLSTMASRMWGYQAKQNSLHSDCAITWAFPYWLRAEPCSCLAFTRKNIRSKIEQPYLYGKFQLYKIFSCAPFRLQFACLFYKSHSGAVNKMRLKFIFREKTSF